jgi:hypothetical protein
MAHVLVASYGGGHAQMMIPVVRTLCRSDHICTVLGLTTGKSLFEHAGITCVGLAACVSSAPWWSEAECWGLKVLAQSEQSAAVSREDTIAYYGSGLSDLVLELGEAEAWQEFLKHDRKCFRPMRTARYLLESIAPDVLVCTNSPRMERALIEQARALNIPTLVLVDAFARIEMDWLSQPGYGSIVAVFHDSVRCELVARGRRPNEVIVTGNPGFGDLAQVRKARRSRPKRKRPHVLYLSQAEALISGSNVDPDRVTFDVMGSLQAGMANDQWTAEVRFHPNQGEHVRGACGTLLDRSHLISLHDALMEADIVISASSSAGIQAMLVGIPLVEIGWSIRSGLTPFHQLGPMRVASSVGALADCIGSLHAMAASEHDEAKPESIEGSAEERVLEALCRLIESDL